MNNNIKDLSLDPEDWSAARALGHKMVDDMIDFLSTIREKPVWSPIPADIKETYKGKLPMYGQPMEEIYEEFQNHILPYYKGNIHPRFWAWVQGTGNISAVWADMWASAMNGNVAIGEHAAMYIDNQVVSWCKEMMDWPMEGSGFLTSGGSMANFTALTVARNAKTDQLVRNFGLKALDRQLVLYCSTETHSCVIKGIETLGLGRDNIRFIAVNKDFTIDINALEKAIETDLVAGHAPFCIVANVGTVNTGAVDDVNEILRITETYQLWCHIDGAFGALAKLAPSHSQSLKNINKADSIAFDLHKWMYMPYEIGCVLVRTAQDHYDTFSITPSYLMSHERGLAAGPLPTNNIALELSRGFKALKAWMSIKEHGMEKYSQLIQQNIDQAQYLGALVEQHPTLELCTPVSMNITCFRYIVDGYDLNQLNVLNKEVLMTLQERGIASPSNTMLNGVYCIRVANVNHRTKKVDFDILVEAVVAIGGEMLKK